MEYNIHPILVHFPVVLLFLYAVIKILPLSKWMPKFAWKDVEKIFLVLGTLGAIAAYMTGEIAEEIVQPNHQLVEMHSTFATISVIIFVILLIIEIISVYKPGSEKLASGIFVKILAFLGLIAITVTGMLGGVITHGLTTDPIAPIIIRILGINL